MSEYQAKLKSLGFSRKKGTTKETKNHTGDTTIVTKEHWNDRVDSTVYVHKPLEK